MLHIISNKAGNGKHEGKQNGEACSDLFFCIETNKKRNLTRFVYSKRQIRDRLLH